MQREMLRRLIVLLEFTRRYEYIEPAIRKLVYSSSTSIDVCTRLARPADPGTNLKGDVRLQVAPSAFSMALATHRAPWRRVNSVFCYRSKEQPTCSASQGARRHSR
jgi:hypothetical protein